MTVILLLLVGFLYIVPLWSIPFLQTHDGVNIVARVAAYYSAFSDGSIIPRWAGFLNFGYGTPVLSFFYPLPGYLGALLHLLGLSFENSYKVLLSISFIGSFATFYLWMSQLVAKRVAFIGGMMYGLLPYHFLNLYVRGDVGELTALCFVPLVLYCIDKLEKERRLIHAVGIAAFYALVILSHNGISLMMTPVLLLYSMLFSSRRQTTFLSLASFAVGLGLSAFFWLPALLEQKYVNASLFIADMYKHHFPTLLDLFSIRWGFGPDINGENGLSAHLGIVQEVLALGFLIIASIYKILKKAYIFWFGVLFFALFISTQYSSFIWDSLSLLRIYQFPWRFIALASFAMSVVATYAASHLSKRMQQILLIALLLSSIFYLQVQQGESQPDSYYSSFQGTTYYHGEASTIWTAGDPSKRAEQEVHVLSGNGEITSFSKHNTQRTYTIHAKSDVRILDETIYYPGWVVQVGSNKIPIEFQDIQHRGLITYNLPSGEHHVKVSFTETKTRMAANLISGASFLLLIIFAVYVMRKKR